MFNIEKINSYIDHTLLKPEATAAQIERLCAEALDHKFFGICVNGSWIGIASRILRGSAVKVISVAGFPLGSMSSNAKCFETESAIRDGADEIDFVLNIGRLKQGDRRYVLSEISSVVRSAGGKPVKVILETSLLSHGEKIEACRLAMEGGAHFVKTSTGFSAGGATLSDVRLLRETVGPDFGVKASGGIRDQAKAVAMIEAGANRLGTSGSVAIIQGEK